MNVKIVLVKLSKAPIAKCGLAREDNIKVDYKLICCDDVEWIYLAANRNE
jgi:hypothetical protein